MNQQSKLDDSIKYLMSCPRRASIEEIEHSFITYPNSSDKKEILDFFERTVISQYRNSQNNLFLSHSQAFEMFNKIQDAKISLGLDLKYTG